MFAQWTYWMWTQGTISATLTVNLNPARSYLVTGALAGKQGGDYGQVYISTVCTQRSSDQVLCGVRDIGLGPEDKIKNLGIAEFLQNATEVTITLDATGGRHRAEGVIFDIT